MIGNSYEPYDYIRQIQISTVCCRLRPVKTQFLRQEESSVVLKSNLYFYYTTSNWFQIDKCQIFAAQKKQ